jgi:hypothetical protein
LFSKSPSYFAGDLRKLKVVGKEKLFDRANRHQREFFSSIQNALVTSIKGAYAEAHRMSGGDYDGDRVWLTWNTNIIDCLPKNDKFIEENVSNLSTEASDFEKKLFSNCNENDIIEYMLHFRNHHKSLGQLSECLDLYIDKYGFDNARTKEIGRAAFLQVCHKIISKFYQFSMPIYCLTFLISRLTCRITHTPCKYCKFPNII